MMVQERNWKKTWISVKKHRSYYLLLLPLIVYFIVFSYLPMYGVVIAFKDYKLSRGIMASEWVGLEHFIDLFSSYKFKTVMVNTLLISLYRLIFSFPAPVIFALFLNEIRFTWFKKTVQTISYLPHFISWVILAGIFKSLLSPTTGAVNAVIQFFGAQPVYFMAEPSMFRGLIVVTGIWAGVGWGSIIYLSAIAGVDAGQYEAAYIEGANRLQCMWYITLPSIMPIVSISFIMSMGGLLNAGFDQIYNMMNDITITTGDVLDTYVYRLGLKELDYSFSAAVGLFKNVVGLLGVLITNFVVKRLGEGQNTLW